MQFYFVVTGQVTATALCLSLRFFICTRSCGSSFADVLGVIQLVALMNAAVVLLALCYLLPVLAYTLQSFLCVAYRYSQQELLQKLLAGSKARAAETGQSVDASPTSYLPAAAAVLEALQQLQTDVGESQLVDALGILF